MRLPALHRPETATEAEQARRRLAFEELLVLQLGLLRRRRSRATEVAASLGAPGEIAGRYRSVLPFTLTAAQERAIAEIDRDLAGTEPMDRLLQGDVGSGKTVVALYALVRAVERGYQGALMAPTETLAEQHFMTIEGICQRVGVKVVLLTSGLSAARACGRARGDLERCGGNRRWDARTDPGRRRPSLAGRGGRRRAAPVRGRAACRARP